MLRNTICVLLVLGLAAVAGAYTPPSDEEVAQLLSAPSQLQDLVEGATPAEVAEVVFRVIRMAEESPNLDEYQKRQVAALMTARGVFVIQVGDAEFMSTLMGYMYPAWKALCGAAGLAASRDSVHDVKEILGMIADREQEPLIQQDMFTAIEEPRDILGDELYYIIAAILPHVPIKDIPAATLSIPLPPPPPFPESQGRRRPVTPPPSKKYPGQ